MFSRSLISWLATVAFCLQRDAIARLVEQGLGISIVAETHSLPLYRIGLARPERLDKGRYIYLTYHRLRYHGKGAKEMMDFVLKRSPLDEI